MAYKKYSEQEIIRAAETDLVDMLRRQGEELKSVGSEYEWKHGADRITIRGSQWYNHYELKHRVPWNRWHKLPRLPFSRFRDG